jgi:hypothetical protein
LQSSFACIRLISIQKQGDNKCELIGKHSTLAKDKDITVVKLMGSIGFQHMELVFVCIEKRAKQEGQISIYMTFSDKNIDREDRPIKIYLHYNFFEWRRCTQVI